MKTKNQINQLKRMEQAVKAAVAAEDKYYQNGGASEKNAYAAWENAFIKSINESKKEHDDD